MKTCKCGGTVAQHPLTETESTTREAWKCTQCGRYEIVTREKSPGTLSAVARESRIAVDNVVLN